MTIEKILVVDDEMIMRNFLVEALKRKGFETVGAENGEKALKLIQEFSFDMVITDMKMPGLSGMEVLKKIKETSPQIVVIVVTAFGTIENAVEAMKAGAFHYLIKPFSLESLIANIEKANQHMVLVEENRYLRQQVLNHPNKREVIAESPAMQHVLKEIEQIAKSQANVFINGETGTGKEVMAHLIHHQSSRASKPFIKVNCAAIPETLIESEFFGHEKGAFTGAANKRLGRFELANGGSLLLDEITEIPLNLQAKLLRITQEQEFERVGGSKSIQVDVRLISTSNRDIKEAINSKVLREDLYYRLNVIPIYLPPLRERLEDIIPLAQHFMEIACCNNHIEKKKLSPSAQKKLLHYRWPGNVRELASVMERVVIMHPDQLIDADGLYLEGPNTHSIVGKTLQEIEKQLITETLQMHEDRTEAAKTLGINLKTLRSKLQEYNLA
jgi:two-component system, NtrC family, response regulator AtoC